MPSSFTTTAASAMTSRPGNWVGTKPSELPIERPLQYEFVVNTKAADALGLKLPQALLLRATDVVG